MCGGVEFKKSDANLKIFFPNPKAELPVLVENDLQHIRWGRRSEEQLALPQGGWARQTSIDQGKWNVYSPEPVLIPVESFMEKDVENISRWFKLDQGSFIQGILVRAKSGERRVYVVTEEASEERAYIHPRFPKIVREDGEPGLAEVIQGGTEKRGRASSENPVSRFEKCDVEFSNEVEDSTSVPTEVFYDSSKSILVKNDSPDVGFGVSLNPYRGCEHGCIYCYARPSHEYLGLSSGVDFESKIIVKKNASDLLYEELASLNWQPQVIAMSGVTDLYQPIERKLEITRRCLEVLVEFRNPVGIVTKSQLVTRDIDLLQELARFNAVCVYVSLTTLDDSLASTMEPRASRPQARLAAIEALSKAGIPVGVMTAPIIPGLTDHEIPDLLSAAVDAGARFAGHTIVRLPFEVKNLFDSWLTRHFPDRKSKVLSRILSIRDGKMNDSQFGSRMSGSGEFASQIHQIHEQTCKKLGIHRNFPELSTRHFRRASEKGQLFLWD